MVNTTSLKYTWIAFIALAFLLFTGCKALPLARANFEPYPPPENKNDDKESAGNPYPPPGNEDKDYPTATQEYKAPPKCEFILNNGGTSKEVDSLSEEFTFNEPKVILTSKTPIGIVDWMDDAKLLISRRDPDKYSETIEIFDIVMKESQVIAQRHNVGGLVFWSESPKTVVYVEVLMEENRTIQYDLWGSSSELNQNEKIAENISPFSAFPGTNNNIYYLPNSGDMLQKMDLSTRTRDTFGVNIEKWKYPKDTEKIPANIDEPNSWLAISNPNESKMVFYTDPWMFLVDTGNWDICEVELGDFIGFNLTWSSDSRYLAMGIIPASLGGVEFSSLAVIDMVSSILYQIDLDLNFVWEMAWLPDSKHLLIMGDPAADGTNKQKLVLFDIETKDFYPILPVYTFGGGSELGQQLTLSKDGKLLAVKCPLWDEIQPLILTDQICIISIDDIP